MTSYVSYYIGKYFLQASAFLSAYSQSQPHFNKNNYAYK